MQLANVFFVPCDIFHIYICVTCDIQVGLLSSSLSSRPFCGGTLVGLSSSFFIRIRMIKILPKKQIGRILKKNSFGLDQLKRGADCCPLHWGRTGQHFHFSCVLVVFVVFKVFMVAMLIMVEVGKWCLRWSCFSATFPPDNWLTRHCVGGGGVYCVMVKPILKTKLTIRQTTLWWVSTMSRPKMESRGWVSSSFWFTICDNDHFVKASLWFCQSHQHLTGPSELRWSPMILLSPYSSTSPHDHHCYLNHQVRVCEVVQHPSYNPDNVDYDFSVLRLCEELQFQVFCQFKIDRCFSIFSSDWRFASLPACQYIYQLRQPPGANDFICSERCNHSTF